MSHTDYFVIESRDRKLLRSALNEVLNGFALDHFETAIGIGRSELQQVFKYLSELSDDAKAGLTRAHLTAAHNALREALRELGIEEFQTRTGFEFQEAEMILKKLSDLLGEAPTA
ncbi:MAG TPA: hypothetical protein VGJ69_06025 [Pyrinomonadaceae bacterium]|jgi:hypothetical protein